MPAVPGVAWSVAVGSSSRNVGGCGGRDHAAGARYGVGEDRCKNLGSVEHFEILFNGLPRFLDSSKPSSGTSVPRTLTIKTSDLRKAAAEIAAGHTPVYRFASDGSGADGSYLPTAKAYAIRVPKDGPSQPELDLQIHESVHRLLATVLRAGTPPDSCLALNESIAHLTGAIVGPGLSEKVLGGFRFAKEHFHRPVSPSSRR